MHKKEGYRSEVTLRFGMYAKLHIETSKWHLFDANGKVVGKYDTIRECEVAANK